MPEILGRIFIGAGKRDVLQGHARISASKHLHPARHAARKSISGPLRCPSTFTCLSGRPLDQERIGKAELGLVAILRDRDPSN
ncbi:hypothetical protein [Ruegeria profundi]|uniref:hypothetical protein n=1 Tax=Ruegeria profundi TaxID=1685378 RepID=UPI0014705DEA|nr:hypothetical protein [Ruegeria profundi]